MTSRRGEVSFVNLFLWGRESGCYSSMADELEALWSKLSFTEEEGEDIALGSNSTKAAREIGKNCGYEDSH